jgi:hypothetical protein
MNPQRYFFTALALLLLLLPLTVTTQVRLQWEPSSTGLPEGSVMTRFVGGPDTVYGIGGRGLYRFDPTLNRWSLVLEDTLIDPIAVLRSGVLLASTRKGLLRTANGGETWRVIEQPGFRSFERIDSVTALGVTQAGELLRWNDRVASWDTVNVPGSSVVSAIVPAGGPWLILDREGARYVSSDQGATWRPVTTSEPFDRVVRLGSRLLAEGRPGTLESVDEGATFTTIAAWQRGQFLKVSDDGTLYSKDYQTIYRSFDSGATWSEFGAYSAGDYHLAGTDTLWTVNGDRINRTIISEGRTWPSSAGVEEPVVTLLRADSTGGIYAMTMWGLYGSFDTGRSWRLLNRRAVELRRVLNAGTLLVTYRDELAGKQLCEFSPDQGRTWRELPTTDAATTWLEGNNGVLVTGDQFGMRYDTMNIFHLSTDNGTTWLTSQAFGIPLSMTFTRIDQPFATFVRELKRDQLDWTLFTTTNDGRTWEHVDGRFTPWVRSFIVAPDSSLHVTFADTASAVTLHSMSTDQGATWSESRSLPSGVTYITGAPQGALLAREGHRSTDGGRTWSPIPPAPDFMVAADASLLVKGTPTRSGGYSLLRSTDLGDSWNSISGDLSGGQVRAGIILRNGTVLAASLTMGVMRTTLPSRIDGSMPTRTERTMTITAGDAGRTSLVTTAAAYTRRISIHDMLGAVRLTLRLDAGIDRLRLPVDNMASGRYIIRIDDPAGALSAPLLLVR